MEMAKCRDPCASWWANALNRCPSCCPWGATGALSPAARLERPLWKQARPARPGPVSPATHRLEKPSPMCSRERALRTFRATCVPGNNASTADRGAEQAGTLTQGGPSWCSEACLEQAVTATLPEEARGQHALCREAGRVQQAGGRPEAPEARRVLGLRFFKAEW